MSLLEKQVAASLNENALNKRLVNNSYKAVVDANKFKETSRKPQKIIYGKSSLLDKIITSNLNENAVNKRLEQISYSAIDGQRQTGTPYAPEGVQMLGQMGQEKPLEAITKEMIKEYQEEEQKPFMVDGEARKYMKADYQPILQVPQSLDEIKDDLRIVYKNKVATAKTIKDAEEYLKTADEYYRGLIRDINVFGMTDAKQKEKEQTERHIIQEKMKYDKLRNQMDKYEYELKRLMNEGKEIKRQNALIPEKNREEVAKYEQSLLQSNRNRLNLQQQPYESDMDYYKRLQEIEKEKVNPALYKQYSVNKASKELKPKLENLFKDESMIEGVIKSLSENDKMIINKNFDKIEKEFINKYGYNPSMNTKMAVNAVLEPLADTSSKIKALIQRKNAQDLYIPDLKSKQESEAQQEAFETLRGVFKRKKIEPKYARVVEKSRQIEEEKAQQDAFETLKGVFKRKKIEPKYARVVKKSREMEAQQIEEGKAATNIQKMFRGRLARSKQQAKMDELASQKKALSKISSAFSRSLVQPEVRDILEQQGAINVLKSAILRSNYQPKLRALKEVIEKKEAKKKEKQYMRTQEAYLQDIEKRLPMIEGWVDYIKEQQEKEIAPQKKLLEREMMSKPASLIQRVVRGHRGRKEYENVKADRLVQLSMEAQQRGQLSPSATALSGATTVAEQVEAGLRKPRSDIGVLRGEYSGARKAIVRTFMEGLSPEEKSAWNKIRRVGGMTEEDFMKRLTKEREERQGAKSSAAAEPEKKLSPMEKALQEKIAKQLKKVEKTEPSAATARAASTQSPPRAEKEKTPSPPRAIPATRTTKTKTLAEQLAEKKLKKTEKPEGSGLRKPKRRQSKVSSKDKKKNRLQLVVSQIKAGNTNPKLIVEVNKLYKDLYDIDNAIMLLK